MSFDIKIDLSKNPALTLENIFTDLFLFIDELSKDYGEPVESDENKLGHLKDSIVQKEQSTHLIHQKHFYLIERVQGEVLFSHNVDAYLGLNPTFDLMEFHSRIQDGISGWHYLQDYLSWGKMAYLFFKEISHFDDLKLYSYKIHIPMLFADGQSYWVLQESKPVEFDAKGNMLSHLNIYTVCRLYDLKKPVNLHGEFYRNGMYCKDWNELYLDSRLMVQPFLLSPVQREIVIYYFNNPNATRQACADALKYPLNTIKKYISDSQFKKGIIDKAHAAFPHIPINNLKDVVRHLHAIGLLDAWNSGYKNSKNGYKHL